MNLCSDKHDEVAYEGRRCPVCTLIEEHRDEIGTLLTKIEEVTAEVAVLEQIKDDLLSQVRDLEAVVNSLPSP